MPDVRVAIDLPYLLILPEGEYLTPAIGGGIRLRHAIYPRETGHQRLAHVMMGSPRDRTLAWTVFAAPDSVDIHGKDRICVEEADRLLRRTNHLLRWYRAVTRQAQITELSKWQVSRFDFLTEASAEQWADPLEYEAAQFASPTPVSGWPKAVRDGLASREDPQVATLALLDAEYAIRTGRFREAVLFCWSAIDSTFGRKYEQLVDGALAGEWAEAREFFKGHSEIPMRHRMSAVMHLVAQRSLYREPGLWKRLTDSYGHRNNIIHRGGNATEKDAELGLGVAREVIDIMNSL